MPEEIVLKYKKYHPDARIDPPAHVGDCGYDIYAVEDVKIPAGEKREVAVGLAFEVPSGYYLSLETRSSFGVVKGLRCHRSVIDAGFRGVYTVVVYNHRKPSYGYSDSTFYEKSDSSYIVKKGDKVGQLVLHKTLLPELQECSELSESTRGENCWGSTDK